MSNAQLNRNTDIGALCCPDNPPGKLQLKRINKAKVALERLAMSSIVLKGHAEFQVCDTWGPVQNPLALQMRDVAFASNGNRITRRNASAIATTLEASIPTAKSSIPNLASQGIER